MEYHATSERRRFPRERVTWLVRLWLTDAFSVSGCAVNASVHGLWLDLSTVPTRFLHVGKAYRLQVRPGIRNEFTCWAVLRRVDQRGVALETRSQLPAASAAHSRAGAGAVGAGSLPGGQRDDASRACASAVVAELPGQAGGGATSIPGHDGEPASTEPGTAKDTSESVGVRAEQAPEEQLPVAVQTDSGIEEPDHRGLVPADSISCARPDPAAWPTISPMRIATERLGGVTIVALYGDLDLESAEEVKQTLTGRIDEGATAIVLDLAGVPYIDSSGLGAVVCAMKRARASGADIHLCGLQAEVQSTLTITGLIKHVEVYADRDETLAALATASAAPGPRSSPGLVSASA